MASVVAGSDVRHSVVGKSRPLAQRALEAFGDAPPPVARSEFGRFEVREIEVKSALTRCAMPGEDWPWSLNPYVGCSHDCLYCYVPDVAHLERSRWGSYTIVKRNLPTVLAHELKRKERRTVFLSSATDPYQPVEKDHRITERCLEILLRAQWPLSVLTRSPLVKRDLSLITAFHDVTIGMSVPTLDEEMRRLVEPGAPPIEGRLRTLRALADAGLAPYVNLAPAYPLSGGVTPRDMARAFKEAGVAVVNASAWRYLANVIPALENRMPENEARELRRAVTDAAYYGRLFRQLRAAFREEGVPLRVWSEAPGTRA